jgi:hypothetical protein
MKGSIRLLDPEDEGSASSDTPVNVGNVIKSRSTRCNK